MNETRWRKVWEVFWAARELPVDERRAYAQLAITDSEALHELLAMLAREQTADSPSAQTAANEDAPQEWSRVGQTVGRFTIIGPLGRGGMGEVYRAQDLELHRTVALKFLSSDIGSAETVNGFMREAQAASALNHPGIVTVYDVVRADSAVGIVMELIEGIPLRSLCGKKQSAAQVADWGHQIALALAAAHAAGIVHRDIKPENLMLRSDGFVKVLDFGLARQVEGGVLNSVGSRFAGTLRYMSPEQVRGDVLRPPTDVFTLGIVLYELATGVHPFASDSTVTAMETHVATPAPSQQFDALLVPYLITTRDPVNAAKIDPSIPVELDSLLLEMLDKDPAKRPAADIVAKRFLAIKHGTVEPQKSRHWHLPSFPLSRIASAILVIAALAGAILWTQRGPAVRSTTPMVIEGQPLTGAPGNETNPAFSPDGRQVAYTWNGGSDGHTQSIYVRLVEGGNPLRLTSGNDDDNPVWSPDASKIAFLRYSPAGTQVVIVPALGGAQRVIATVADARITRRKLLAWSPDPDELVVADTVPGPGQGLRLGLYGVRISSGQKRLLTQAPEGMDDMEPVFSHNGRKLAFLRRHGNLFQIHVLNELGGSSRQLAASVGVQGLAWSAGNRSLIFCTEASPPRRVQIVSEKGGEPIPAPFQFGMDVRALVLSSDGRMMAFVHEHQDSNIWARSNTHPVFHPLIASTRTDEDPRISPDGKKIAFTSNRTGKYEIWVCDRDGSNPHPVTAQGIFAGSTAWSPDGRTLAYDSAFRQATEVWLVSADGGPSRPLFDPALPGFIPNWSADGTSIYFVGKGSQIWKAPVAGGPPVQVTQHGGLEGFETPDGKYLYFVKGLTVRGIWRLPLAGGDEELLPELASAMPFRSWAMAPDGIYYAEAEPEPVLKFFRFQDRKTSIVTKLPSPPQRGERGLSVSMDGSLILYLQKDATRNEILLSPAPQ